MKNKLNLYAEEIFNGAKRGKFRFHRNMVIIGDNSSGKTTILGDLLSKILTENRSDFYYIDSKNRVLFDEDQNINIKYDAFSPLKITEIRADKKYIAKKDVFPDSYPGALATYNELLSDVNKYSLLFQEFIGKTLSKGTINKESIPANSIDKLLEDEEETLIVNEDQEIFSLSSSEAAIMRIVMETEYAVSEKNKCRTIIIDEFDTHFDSKRVVEYMEQLTKKYTEAQFVFVTHNLSDLVNMSEMDALILCSDGTAEINVREIDCDDITEIAQVERIQSKFIGKKREEEVLLDKCVSIIVKGNGDEKKLMSAFALLDSSRLTAKEKILYAYVERKWKNDN